MSNIKIALILLFQISFNLAIGPYNVAEVRLHFVAMTNLTKNLIWVYRSNGVVQLS